MRAAAGICVACRRWSIACEGSSDAKPFVGAATGAHSEALDLRCVVAGQPPGQIGGW